MSNNDFMLSIIAALNKQLSAKSIKGDLKSLDNKFYVKVLAKLSKTLATKELQNQLKQLKNLYVQVGANVKIDKDTKSKIEQNIKLLQSQISDLEIGLSASKTQQAKLDLDIAGIIKRLQSKINSEPLEFNLELKKSKLIADIEYLGKRYSKLFANTSASKKYENLMQNALSITGKNQLADTRTELATFTSELKANGLASKSTGDKWRALVDRSKDLFSAAAAVRIVFSQMRQAISETISIDKLLTDYSKVQDDITRSDYPDYLAKCNKRAQELATTQKALIESATEFSKSGYDSSKSDVLSERSIKLANVGDMSASDSAKAIISGVQAYDTIDGYDDTIDKADALIDKYNEIGNTASITTEEIAKGVQSVGSVFADANTSVDELISLLSAGNRQYQDADALALGLRTSALRIRGCTAELEAMGEETDGVITSTSKLAEKIEALTNVNGNGGVKILEDDEQTFRSIYGIYADIGKVYKQMSDTDQSALLDLIAGKHRASGISAVLNNMTEAQEILQNSLNSAGSAEKEYEKYLESAEAHINQFKAKLVETYSTFMNGDTIKYAADFGTAMLDILNYTDLLRHGLLAIASIKLGQGISTIGLSIADAAKQMNTLGSALQQIKSLPLDSVLKTKVLADVGNATKNLTDKNLKLLLSQKQLLDNDKVQILLRHNLTEEEARAKLEKMGLISATITQTTANTANTTSTFTLSGALTALKASAIGAGQAMKAAFLSNPIGFVLMGITTIASAASTAMSNHKQKLEETRRANIEAADSASETADNLRKLYSEYFRLNSIQDKTTTQEDEYKTVIEDITSSLGERADALKTLKQGTEEYTAKLKELTQAELQEQHTSAVVGRKSAEETLQETIWSNWNGSKVSVDSDSKGKSLPVEAQQAVDIVSDALKDYETINRTWENISWDISSNNPDEAVKYFEDLLKARTDLVNASKDNEALLNTQIYEDINNAINIMSDDLDTYINKRYEELKIGYLVSNTIPTTAEEYQKMEDVIVSNLGLNEALQSKIKDLLTEDFSVLYAKVQDEIESVENLKLDITPTLSITDTIDQLNTQLKPAFDSLKSAYKDIFTDDGFTLENVDMSMLDSIKSSIDSLNEMDGIEIDYSSFENLAKVLTDTSSASDDVQASINTLATEIVSSLNPALKDVTGESYQLVQQMLESLGVQNAEQVMISSLGYTYSEYTAAKQECANAGFDLANATEEEIANFIVEQGGAENCGEALALLQLKKLLLNTTRIDQTSDINNILTLAGAAGVASESMVRLANAKLLLDNAVANNDSRGIAVAKQELIDAGQAAKDSVLDFKPVELDFSPASSSKSKGSGSKSEKDTYLESYKKERAELEHLHNMELITDKEFYDRLRDLNEKYFNDTAEHHEKYLDEYQSNEEKIFKGLKQVYQDSLEEHKSMMDSAASHAQRVLDKEIDKLKSDSKTTIKHYEQRIDAIDKEIDAKQGIIDKYQDELDAMELANQKRKDAIALQKAQYELDRVQNQRTIGQYQNGQKIYLTDGKAVRDAEDDRDEAEYNIKRTEIQEKISLVQKEIDALEAKQDRLQAKIDQENQALDAQIEKLEAYKERWAEIAEKQTIAQEEAAFLAICGAEGEAEILAMREGILQGFSDNYDAITTNLADLAQANADRMAEIASQMESAASRAAKAASDMARAQASMSSSKGEKYASGTKSAKRGLNLVAEEKPEAIIDNEGVRLITKPTLLQMSGGEQVLNGKETETLLDGGTSLSPRIKELLSRSQIESIGNFANMNIMPSFQHNVKLPSFDFSKLQTREQPQKIEVNIGDIKLDNVKDSHSLARDIVNRMPSYVIQEINKR